MGVNSSPGGEHPGRAGTAYRTKSVSCQAWQWDPTRIETVGAVVGTLMAYGIPIRHPSGMGTTVTLQLGDDGTGPIAQPGDWLVCVDGRWGIVAADDFAARYEPADPEREAAASFADRMKIDTIGHRIAQLGEMSSGPLCSPSCDDDRALRAELVDVYTQLQLAIGHDRQPYPTAWAYEQSCAAREAHRARADAALAVVARVRAIVEPATRNVQRDAARLARRILAELGEEP